MALRAAYLALHRRSDARFARHGVTADQFVLLATLARAGQPSPSGNSPAACRPTPAPCGPCSCCWRPRAGRAGRAPDRRPRPDGRPHGGGPAGVPAALDGGRAGPGADCSASSGPARRKPSSSSWGASPRRWARACVPVGGSTSSPLSKGRTMSGRILALVTWATLAWLIVPVAAQDKEPGKQVPKKFEQEVKVKVELDYLLYLPKEYGRATRSGRCLLFLHGAGESRQRPREGQAPRPAEAHRRRQGPAVRRRLPAVEAVRLGPHHAERAARRRDRDSTRSTRIACTSPG